MRLVSQEMLLKAHPHEMPLTKIVRPYITILPCMGKVESPHSPSFREHIKKCWRGWRRGLQEVAYTISSTEV